MKQIKSWLQASRLPSQAYIYFPLLVGAGAAAWNGSPVSLLYVFFTMIFGLLLQLYIVYANDYADYETDIKNTTFTMFSGGSRVLPENRIKRNHLKTAAVIVVFLNMAMSVIHAGSRPYVLLLLAVSVLLLWMYSFNPVMLSYRGGGEFLQVIGVGIVLPAAGYYFQTTTFADFPVHWFLFIIPLDIAAALATTLPDQPSDSISKKRTLTVIFGAPAVKRIIILCNLAGLILFISVSGVPIKYTLATAALPLMFSFTLFFFAGNSEPGTKRLAAFVALAVGVKVIWGALFASVLLFNPCGP